MSGTLAIPASAIVNVTPSVISAGGTALDLNGLILTTSDRVPTSSVRNFSSLADVSSFFGASSEEARAASIYFLGFDNSNKKPGEILFTQYNQSAVGAWLRGGSMSGVTLAMLQAMSGTLTVVIDGVSHDSSPINLSSATSFSDGAELITIALGLTGPNTANFTGSIAGSVLTVSAVSTGTVGLGDEIKGSGILAGTQVASYGTGSGGTGTYNLTTSQTISSEAMTANVPTVSYDSITASFVVRSATTGTGSTISFGSNTIAADLKLTEATGATTSQGLGAADPVTFMSNVTNQTQNWAAFMTLFDPDNSGNANKQLFASWANSGVLNRYAYVVWDTDITPTLSDAATTSLGYIIKQSNSSGTIPIYATTATQGVTLAAFELGSNGSVDFDQINGRATMAFKSQTGITPDVNNQTVGDHLIANGYNFYGGYATANDSFRFFYPGSISGPFKWIDSYLNQIWLNNQFQLALMVLLTNAKSIPYNQAGYGLIRAALQDPINQGLTFGAFRPGVTLSEAQKVEVNSAAGTRIDDVLTNQGWFLQVRDATPQVRAARGSPPCTFWYTDGQSVHKINLASVEVQ